MQDTQKLAVKQHKKIIKGCHVNSFATHPKTKTQPLLHQNSSKKCCQNKSSLRSYLQEIFGSTKVDVFDPTF